MLHLVRGNDLSNKPVFPQSPAFSHCQHSEEHEVHPNGEHLCFFQMLSTMLLPLACLSVGPNIITQRGVPVPEEREAIMIIAMMRRKRSATVRIVDLAVTHKTHNNSNKQTTSSLRVCVCIFDVSSITTTTTTIIHSVKISKDRIAKLII